MIEAARDIEHLATDAGASRNVSDLQSRGSAFNDLQHNSARNTRVQKVAEISDEDTSNADHERNAAHTKPSQDGSPTEMDRLRRLVALQQDTNAHQERCKRLEERIAMDERQHGMLLMELDRLRQAAEARAAMIKSDKLAYQRERELLVQKKKELTKLLDRHHHQDISGL